MTLPHTGLSVIIPSDVRRWYYQVTSCRLKMFFSTFCAWSFARILIAIIWCARCNICMKYQDCFSTFLPGAWTPPDWVSTHNPTAEWLPLRRNVLTRHRGLHVERAKGAYECNSIISTRLTWWSLPVPSGPRTPVHRRLSGQVDLLGLEVDQQPTGRR